jgi:hypothetical protein
MISYQEKPCQLNRKPAFLGFLNPMTQKSVGGRIQVYEITQRNKKPL